MLRLVLAVLAFALSVTLAGLGRNYAPVDFPREAWDRPMTVMLVRSSAPGCEPLCPEWLAAEGQITATSPDVFRKALQQAGDRQLPIIIASPGGDVNAALEIGRLVRRAKLPVGVGWTHFAGQAPYGPATSVPPEGFYRGEVMIDGGFCNSACPLILAGGTERLAGEHSFVGLHVIRRQWIEEKITYRETQRIVRGRRQVEREETGREKVGSHFKDGIDAESRSKILAYLSAMGVSAEFIDEMAKAPFTDINHVQQSRLRDMRLVTSDDTIRVYATPDSCKSTTPVPNCRLASQVPASAQFAAKDAAAPSARHGKPAAVYRARAKGECEPLCPEWIVLDGDITRKSAERLQALIDALEGHGLPVFLNSQGGDFDAAMRIGRLIRKRGLVTAVGATRLESCAPADLSCGDHLPVSTSVKARIAGQGECGRECLFALAGGIERWDHLASPSRVPIAATLLTVRVGKSAAELAENYLRDMSVSTEVLAPAGAPTAESPLLLNQRQRLATGLSTHDASPLFMTEAASCQTATSLPNCTRRDIRVDAVPAFKPTSVDLTTPATTPPVPRAKPAVASAPRNAASRPVKPAAKSAKAPAQHRTKPGRRPVVIYGGL